MNDAAPASHPCQRCGACCATYRVSFYWADGQAHGLPDALTAPLTPWHACMDGTQRPSPRCVALDGEVGRSVACRVYAQRPSPCRELQPGEDKCLRARQRHALPPLALDDAIVLPTTAPAAPVPSEPVGPPPTPALPLGDNRRRRARRIARPPRE